MTDEPQGRRNAAFRQRDEELDRWRGTITEQVRTLDRAKAEHNGDLRDLRTEVGALRRDVVILQSQVSEARVDIGEATAAMKEGRRQENADLRAAIKDSKVAGRDLWIHVVAPITVLVVGALIIFALIGTHP